MGAGPELQERDNERARGRALVGMFPVQHMHNRMSDYGNRAELQSKEDHPDEPVGNENGGAIKSRFMALSYLSDVHVAVPAECGNCRFADCDKANSRERYRSREVEDR